jgi:hypothetical protein
MNRRLGRVALVLAVAALVGCGAERPASTLGSAGKVAAKDDLLFLGAGPAIRALAPTTGEARFKAESARPLPDWSALVNVGPDGKLAVLDGTTGEERSSRTIAGGTEVRAVSVDGLRVALMPASPPGASPYLPAGRERTTISIVDVGTSWEPKTLTLEGNFEPEAFSVDGGALFALEWLPPTRPDRYRVRRIEIANGAVNPVITREKQINLEEMRGEGRQQLLAPNKQTLFTLYTAQPDHVHSRDMLRRANGQSTPMVHAFVHTLGLDVGWTYCIDLPLPFGLGPTAAHTIAVAPDGGSLFVADLSTATVARVDARELKVVKVATLSGQPDPAAEKGTASSVVTPDGTLYLASGSGVIAVDGATLALKARYPIKGATAGLGLSPDGHRLYVGQAGGVAVLDTADGRQLGTIAASGFDLVRHVGRIVVR